MRSEEINGSESTIFDLFEFHGGLILQVSFQLLKLGWNSNDLIPYRPHILAYFLIAEIRVKSY